MAAHARLTQLPWDQDLIDAMAPSVAASPWSLVDGVADALGGSHLFQIEQGRVRVLLAMRGTTREGGRVLEVVGMRSLGERARPDVLWPAVERLARDAYGTPDLLSMCTRHEHLVRMCERAGWARSGFIVNKAMRVQ